MSSRSTEINAGVLTKWIPFTTAGPNVAPECSTKMYLVPTFVGPPVTSIVAYDPSDDINKGPNPIPCFPLEVVSSYVQSKKKDESTKISLGPFHCPSLYTTALARTVDEKSTSVMCCPSDYALNTADYSSATCVSTLQSGTLTVYSQLQSSGKPYWAQTIITKVGQVVLAHSVEGYVFAEATTSADTPSRSTSLPNRSSSNTSSPTSSTGPSFNSSPTSTNTTNNAQNEKSSISTGTKAGIAFGCIGAAAFAILAIFMLLRRRNIRRRQPVDVNQEKNTDRDRGISPTAESETLLTMGFWMSRGKKGGGLSPQIGTDMAKVPLGIVEYMPMDESLNSVDQMHQEMSGDRSRSEMSGEQRRKVHEIYSKTPIVELESLR